MSHLDAILGIALGGWMLFKFANAAFEAWEPWELQLWEYQPLC